MSNRARDIPAPDKLEKKIDKCWEKLEAAEDSDDFKKVKKYTNKLLKLNQMFRSEVGVDACVRL